MPKSPDAFVYNATLERIVDGDTFDCCLDLGFDVKLHKQRVRLAGIDTPESRTRDLAEKKLGLAAKSRLQELCIGDIKVKSLGKGKYGRILGIPYTESTKGKSKGIFSHNSFTTSLISPQLNTNFLSLNFNILKIYELNLTKFHEKYYYKTYY